MQSPIRIQDIFEFTQVRLTLQFDQIPAAQMHEPRQVLRYHAARQ